MGRILIATVVAFAVLSADAWADALIYRCGNDVCRAAPDGRRIAFERDGRIYVGRRRVLTGRQPVWTSAPACRNRVRLRVRRRTVMVTACAPQPGRLTVTLRADGRRVGRKTVQTPTGRLVEVRLRRPAGHLRAQARFRQRAATRR